MNLTPLRLVFDRGTIVVTGGSAEDRAQLPHITHDSRTETQRAEARHYRAIVEYLVAKKIPYEDAARDSSAGVGRHRDQDDAGHDDERKGTQVQPAT